MSDLPAITSDVSSVTTSESTHSDSTTPTTSYTIPTAIPNQQNEQNPFIQQSKYREGTLYIIILPAIAGAFLLYLLCTAYMKWKAKRQAKQAPPFEDMYEPKLGKSEIFDLERATTLVPSMTGTSGSARGMRATNSGATFFNLEGKLANIEPAEKIGLARSSMELPFGIAARQREEYNAECDASVGSLLQLHLNSSDGNGPLKNSSSSGGGSKKSGSSTTVYYSLIEPDHAATPSTVSIPNNKKRFHKKALSSVILDEFISTGELPADDPNDTTADMDSIGTDPNVENHSMFEQLQDSSYNADLPYSRSPSPVKRARPRSYHSGNTSGVFGSPSRSPKRAYRQQQQEAPRSPSRRPVRNGLTGSPLRGTVKRTGI
ncbi:DEKNAAC100199 [Brettanomyces naardenensis]|uniref:DEKNAAC100199 n=1 Tax=Brettanomyces naardenensis TaxID=13370 RepID=A0A448YFN6_BRENA|nr:DEKNAAC100199 [Brettanomyces naardenensis]